MAARLTTFVVVAIVAATLIAGLIVGAQRDDSEGPVDLIVHNAAVYTADGDGTMAEAVAIRGNQILRVGGEREILRLRRPQTTVIDAQGAAVLPGFNDAHVHFIAGGLNLDKVDLLGALTIDEVQGRITAWSGTNPDSPWVVGRGWRYESFPGGLPTRQLLDALVSDRPAQLAAHDGHAVWVNSAALKLARISRRTPNPANGVIVKDAHGEPTGVLKGSAIELVERVAPRATREDRVRALRAAIAEAHQHGITSVQNAGGSPDDFELYVEARKAGDLRLRVYSALVLGTEFTDDDRARLAQATRLYPDDPVFKTGAVKVRIDGSIPAHTASMLEPYANRDVSGEPLIPPDDLNRIVRLIDREGWQVMAHAAGDRAVRMALDAYEHAARSNPAPERGRRHRLEHLETSAPSDVPRLGSLGVIASLQPLLGNPTDAWLEARARNIGVERASRGWPYRSIAAAGGRLAFGSDWPSADLSPLRALHAAVTRRTTDGLPEGGWMPAQRLQLASAIDAYTSGAAWASFDEQRKGTLQAGMLADLVVLSSNIFETPAALATARVVHTIFDGRVVYTGTTGTN
jgi:predicted amidohydrolase YtcJ